MSRYVLDSFAMLASYWREPGARHVGELISSAENECWMSVINLGETYYRIAREENTDSAEQALVWIDGLSIQFVDVDWPMTRLAASIKSTYPLSYADCFAAALAQQVDAAVVTGDREFERIERDGVVTIEWLPSRTRGSR